MVALEFPGPGLTQEQWSQIRAIAIALKPGQALWLSGYFAGLDHGTHSLTGGSQPSPAPFGLEAPALAAAPVRSLTILFGTETGNSAGVAKILAGKLRAGGLDPHVVDMADYKPRNLKHEHDLLIVTSTHGDGDPPLSTMGFFEFIEGRKAPRLTGVRFAVLALGDSTYEHYCKAGKRLGDRQGKTCCQGRRHAKADRAAAEHRFGRNADIDG